MAGEGTKKIQAFRKSNKGKAPKPTVFDSLNIVNGLKAAGITHLAKIPAVQENKDVFREHGAGLNTIVILAPDGKRLFKLSGYHATEANFQKLLKRFKKDYELYQKKNAKAG